jgi:hypothetical protein
LSRTESGRFGTLKSDSATISLEMPVPSPHIWKIYDFKMEVVPFIITFSTELTTVNHTMSLAKRKRTKEQATIYKTLHRKLKIEQHELH